MKASVQGSFMMLANGQEAHNAFASILYQNVKPTQPVAYANTQLVLYANPEVSPQTIQQAIVTIKGNPGIPAPTKLSLLDWLYTAQDPRSKEAREYREMLRQLNQGSFPGWAVAALLAVAVLAAIFIVLFIVYKAPETPQLIITVPTLSTTTTTTTVTSTLAPTTTVLTTTTTAPPTTTTETTTLGPTTTTATTTTTTPPNCEVIDVHLSGVAFTPSTVNVRIGDSIRWIWDSGFHNVASSTDQVACIDSGVFRLGDINGNPISAPFNVTLFINTPQFSPNTTVPFICDVHCVFGMRGVINIAIDPCPATTVVTTTSGPTTTPGPTVSTTEPPTTTTGVSTTTGTTGPPTTTTTALTTTGPPTPTPEPLNCIFLNPGFESGLPSPGWQTLNQFAFVLPNAYNPATLNNDILPYNGSYFAQLGWSGAGNFNTGQGYIFQDIVIPLCNATLSFDFRTYGSSTGYGRLVAQVTTTEGAVLVNLLDLNPPAGVSAWATYQCGICDGSCRGVSLEQYVGQTLRFQFGSEWTTLQTAMWIDNVCMTQLNPATVTTPVSTAITTTAPVASPCAFQNPSFETGLFAPFWNPTGAFYFVVGGGAYNPYTGLYNLFPYAGAYQAQVGFAGPGTVTSSNGAVNQAVVIPSCGHRFRFAYQTIGTSPGFATAFARIQTLSGATVLANLVSMPVPIGLTTWTQYSCGICDGTCGGLDMTPYVGQALSFEWGVHWSSFQAAMYVDDVCMEPAITTTALTTTTTLAPTTIPGEFGACVFEDNTFESGAFGNGWEGTGTYQAIVGNAYNPSTQLNDLAPYSGSYQAQVGYPGPISVSSGTGFVTQLVYIPTCGTVSFYYRTYAEQPGYVTVSATVASQAGTPLASLFVVQASPGVGAWTQYTCTMCDGSCGGFTFGPYIGQHLRFTFGTVWSTFQGTMWVDTVCITVGTTISTTAPTTVAPTTSPDVCFVNSGFETGSFSPGWTATGTYQSTPSAAYNVFAGAYNIYPASGSYMGMAGFSGPGVIAVGGGSFRQDMIIPACGYKYTFRYRYYCGLYPYCSISARVLTTGGASLGSFINTLTATGWSGWNTYSCNMCAGSCPIDFTGYVASTLRFDYSVSWYNNAPGALLIDDVCFEQLPTTTTLAPTTTNTDTTTTNTGTTTTVITTTTTTTTTVAPTTSPFPCFVNSGFETGSFAPGWTTFNTYQSVTSAAYNVFTNSYSIFTAPGSGTYFAMAGFTGPGVISTGGGGFRQDMVIPACGGTFTFKYRYYCAQNPYCNVYVRVTDLSNNILASFISGQAATGWGNWLTYSCTMCSGTCPLNFAGYVGQTLRFTVSNFWYNNAPGAILVDDMCFAP